MFIPASESKSVNKGLARAMNETTMHHQPLTRRDVLKWSVAVACATSVAAIGQTEDATLAAMKRDSIRVGFVGIGVKGFQHVRNSLHIPGVEMVAVCDVLEEPCVRAQRLCKTLGMREPVSYTRGEYDFKRMCQEQDLDLVYNATPWEWHVPICLAAIENGKHVATEIPAAITLDDCWKLVETCESTGLNLSMMENVNYRRDELMILRMIRENLLGEVVHCEVGYMHDTRYLKIRDYGDGLWLGAHHAQRNGNLYPTHGLGPVAWNLDLERGNRMEYIVSMSSKARGMNLYAKDHLPEGHPYREREYINGDVNSSLIKTTDGETIILKHDTDLPRPYSRRNLVQGTRGIVRGFPQLEISLEAKHLTKGEHLGYAWQSGRDYYDEYDHPFWRRMSELAQSTPIAADGFDLEREIASGDYHEDFRLIETMLAGESPDFDVYDAASWSVVTALSEQSVANGSSAVDFPDFTKGKWKTRQRLTIAGV